MTTIITLDLGKYKCFCFFDPATAEARFHTLDTTRQLRTPSRGQPRAAPRPIMEAHKLARIVYNVMRFGVAYMKQTEEVYAEQVRDRLEKQLQRRAREMGYERSRIEPAQGEAAEERTVW